MALAVDRVARGERPVEVLGGPAVLAQLCMRRREHVQDVRQQGGRGLGAVRITQQQHLRGKPGCQWAEAGNQAANWPRLAEAGNRPELHLVLPGELEGEFGRPV